MICLPRSHFTKTSTACFEHEGYVSLRTTSKYHAIDGSIFFLAPSLKWARQHREALTVCQSHALEALVHFLPAESSRVRSPFGTLSTRAKSSRMSCMVHLVEEKKHMVLSET